MLTKSIVKALRVFVHGVEAFHRSFANSNSSAKTLSPHVSCEGTDSTSARWLQGEHFFK